MRILPGIFNNAWVSAAVLLTLSVLVYLPSLGNEFVWDDTQVIEKNYKEARSSPVLSHFVPREQEVKNSRYWRPVLLLSYFSDRTVWGPGPRGFHLTNVLANSLAVLAMFAFCVLLFRPSLGVGAVGAAFLASVLFALHPMHVESVAWVSARTDVLMALFFFLACFFHLLASSRGWGGYMLFVALGSFSFALALFSKEVAVVFPAAAVLADLATRGRPRGRSFISYALYAAITAGYLFLRARAFVIIPDLSFLIPVTTAFAAPGAGLGGGADIVSVLGTLARAYYFYVYKTVLPFTFNAFMDGLPGGPLYLASSILTLVLLGVSAAWAWVKGHAPIAFGTAWFALTLLPSAVVSITGVAASPVAERYLYLPTAGLGIVLAYCAAAFSSRRVSRGVTTALTASVIILFCTFTLGRQGVWKTNVDLWSDTVLSSPRAALPRINLGYALRERGMLPEAEQQFLIALHPDIEDTPRGRAITANNLGLVYIDMGRLDRALHTFGKARELDPGYGRTYYHLGLVNFIMGQETGSEGYYRLAQKNLGRALEAYRGYGKAELLMAKVLLELDQPKRARHMAARALRSGLPARLREEAEEISAVDDEAGHDDPE